MTRTKIVERDITTSGDLTVEVVDNPDGSATMHLDIGPKTRKMILDVTGKKRLTKKVVEEFVLSSIDRYIDVHDLSCEESNVNKKE